MRILEKVVPNNFNLFLFGDDHEGTILRHDEGWDMLVDMMQSTYDGCNYNFGVDHGDVVEAIPSDDARWYDVTNSTKVLEQTKAAVNHREKIKKKLVTILDGNHPQKYWRFGAITAQICKDLDVPFGTWSAHITYKTKKGNIILRHFATHGRKFIGSTADDPVRRLSNMKLQLKRHLKEKFADCALMTKGHTHKLLIAEPTKTLYLTGESSIKQHYTSYNPAGGYIHPDHRWYVNTGSFLRLYGLGFDGYAERAGYDPMELGFAVARIRDRQIVGIDKIVLKTPKAPELELPLPEGLQ